MTGRLILVSSYPKSGNTWVRAVLEQLRRPEWEFSINDMHAGFYGHPHRLLFDAMSPVNASDLFTDEVYTMLPKIYAELAKEDDAIDIIKVHDICRRVSTGEWLYPPEAVHSVIYLVRHPFDVAVSFAPHMNLALDQAVQLMADGLVSAESSTGPELPLPQYLDPWSTNVTSWIDDSPHNVTLVRYEDIFADPLAQFSRIARATGFDPSNEELARVLDIASFENLREEEKTRGFRERPRTSSNFFREGKPRSWEGKLDESLRKKIVHDHGAIMARLGYLPDGGITDIPTRLELNPAPPP